MALCTYPVVSNKNTHTVVTIKLLSALILSITPLTSSTTAEKMKCTDAAWILEYIFIYSTSTLKSN